MVDDSKQIRVLIVDDHEMIRGGLRTIIKRQGGNITVVEEAESGERAIELCKCLAPDVVVMDIKLPGMDGIDAIKTILALNNRIKVLVISANFANHVVDRALDAGVSGFFCKGSGWRELGTAIEAVYRDQSYCSESIADLIKERAGQIAGDSDADKPALLSARDCDMIRLVSEGLSINEIAKVFGRSPKTIDNKRREIMARIGVSSIPELVKYALREGISDLY
ncbi:MAG: response regulator transcription factor [Planctomycetes bacterium]|nr:response regulator transcription factor [Planctomycetota bacterium]